MPPTSSAPCSGGREPLSRADCSTDCSTDAERLPRLRATVATPYLVPKGGFEPPRGRPQRFLRPSRLPFRHFGQPHHCTGRQQTCLIGARSAPSAHLLWPHGGSVVSCRRASRDEAAPG